MSYTATDQTKQFHLESPHITCSTSDRLCCTEPQDQTELLPIIPHQKCLPLNSSIQSNRLWRTRFCIPLQADCITASLTSSDSPRLTICHCVIFEAKPIQKKKKIRRILQASASQQDWSLVPFMAVLSYLHKV